MSPRTWSSTCRSDEDASGVLSGLGERPWSTVALLKWMALSLMVTYSGSILAELRYFAYDLSKANCLEGILSSEAQSLALVLLSTN